jgi:hypothetical protein
MCTSVRRQIVPRQAKLDRKSVIMKVEFCLIVETESNEDETKTRRLEKGNSCTSKQGQTNKQPRGARSLPYFLPSLSEII